jgi:hypothetical protein
MPFLSWGTPWHTKRTRPPFFVIRKKAVGPIFRINLAGRRMVIIGSVRHAVQQVASLPESVMSARRAVADIGFDFTLGTTNVFTGIDFHKRVPKDEVLSQKVRNGIST